MFTETELAYIAGFFDGEGCILAGLMKRGDRAPQYQLRTHLNQVAPCPILDELKETYGGCLIYQKYDKAHPKWKPTVAWVLTSNETKPFLEAIYPYLRIKKEQAAIAIEWMTKYPVCWSRGRGVKLSDGEQAYREQAYSKLRQLKGRL